MKISVIIATYNGVAYLKNQIDSILSQNCQPTEILVGDDGSTDGTQNLVSRYLEKIKLFSEPSIGGVASNFERLLIKTQGDWIAFSDQDDIWLPEKLQVLADNTDSCELVHSDALLIDSSGNLIADSQKQYAGINPYQNSPLEILGKNVVTGCTMMISRKLFSAVLPFPKGIVYHDWWLAFVAAKRKSIVYIDTPLILYRQHENNFSGTVDKTFISRIKTWIVNSPDKRQRKKMYSDNASFYFAVLNESNIQLTQKETAVARTLLMYYETMKDGSLLNFRGLFLFLKIHPLIIRTKNPLRIILRGLITFLRL
jgi:glycosyltransferase involved in cell wall biosynthesis